MPVRADIALEPKWLRSGGGVGGVGVVGVVGVVGTDD